MEIWRLVYLVILDLVQLCYLYGQSVRPVSWLWWWWRWLFTRSILPTIWGIIYPRNFEGHAHQRLHAREEEDGSVCGLWTACKHVLWLPCPAWTKQRLFSLCDASSKFIYLSCISFSKEILTSFLSCGLFTAEDTCVCTVWKLYLSYYQIKYFIWYRIWIN